jgi:soluble lytic murein transglycosylase-like protein
MKYSYTLLKFRCITFLFAIMMLAFNTRADVSDYPSVEENIVSQYISEYSLKPIAAQTARRIAQTVYWYAGQAKVDPMLVLALMRQESGFNPVATSREGAKGLMQVLPRAHRVELKGKVATNIETNVDLGIKIYSDCLRARGDVSGALRCYSGGAGKKYRTSVLAYERHAQKYVIEHMFNQSDLMLASNSN